MAGAAATAGVQIVTGDTKVVERATETAATSLPLVSVCCAREFKWARSVRSRATQFWFQAPSATTAWPS